jgi:hypothetical protein
MTFLVARGQGRGLKAGSAGGEDPMKERLSSAEKGGKGLAIRAPQGGLQTATTRMKFFISLFPAEFFFVDSAFLIGYTQI